MKIKNILAFLMALFIFGASMGVASTTVPLTLDVAAVLGYQNGDYVQLMNANNMPITIAIHKDKDDKQERLWYKLFTVDISDGVVEATLEGTDDNNTLLDETLLDHEGVFIRFTIDDGITNKFADVVFTSQPYAIKSALSDMAKDTKKLNGVAVSITRPDKSLYDQVLMYNKNNDQWEVQNLAKYEIAVQDPANEVTGKLGDLRVDKILGVELTKGVNTTSIPTGSVLMYSPNIGDIQGGAFHPSSGAPSAGDLLTWNNGSSAWEPAALALSGLSDVGALSNVSNGQMLSYDGITNEWVAVDPADTSIADGSITSAKIASGAVTNDKLASGIELSKLAQGTAIDGQIIKLESGTWVASDAPSNGVFSTNINGNVHYTNGNVGIGTDIPLSPLHIKGDNQILTLEGTKGHSYIHFYPTSAGRKGYIGSSSTYGVAIDAESNPLTLSGSSTTMYGDVAVGSSAHSANLTVNGNVGIGTTTPQETLDVNGKARINGVVHIQGHIKADHSLVLNAGNTGNIYFRHVTDSGSGVNNYKTLMTIENNGDVTVLKGVSATGFYNRSDRNLKKNITDLPANILDKIRQINVQTYHWKNGDTATSPKSVGVIAQDVLQLFPVEDFNIVIKSDNDDHYSVDYNALSMLNISATQELAQQLDEKDKEIAELKAMVEALTQRMNAIDGGGN